MIEYNFLIQNYLFYIILCPLFINILKINSIIVHLGSFLVISLFNLLFIKYTNLISLWLNFCIFTFLVCIYIFVYGALETSISIKILNKLEKKKTILLSYITKKIVEKSFFKRMNILLRKKKKSKKNKKYALTISGQKIIKLIDKIRNILKLDNLGFYK